MAAVGSEREARSGLEVGGNSRWGSRAHRTHRTNRRRDHRGRTMITAITRAVSPSIAQGERTHVDRQPITYDLAVLQHRQYEDILRGLGCRVVTLEASPDFPDCVFIEDTAVVFDDIALVTRPGAPSRRGEVGPVAACLLHYRPLCFIEEPATIDGGDVLV